MSSAPSKMVLDTTDKSPGSDSEEEDLPDTQPMDSQDPSFDVSKEEEEERGVWGQLFPHCGTFPRIPLKTESFKFGKANGDYKIKETDVGKELFKTISGSQCKSIKNKDGVFLKDYSSNGTFVSRFTHQLQLSTKEGFCVCELSGGPGDLPTVGQ